MSFDYKNLALSATRSSIAYLNTVDVDRLWSISSKDRTNIMYYVFQDVLEAPKFYHDLATDANAYSWVQNKTLHIVFRGSSSVEDFRIDIDDLRVPLFPDNKKILVHKGFLRQFRALEPFLYNEILRRQETVDVIHFSGHSLGAALATLASGFFNNLLKLDGINKHIVCHTIGSSRLGNTGFVDWFTVNVDESVRILNFKDPVPLLPLSINYKHIGGGLELYDDGTIKTIRREKSWFLRFIKLPFEIYYRNPISHHAYSMYISRLVKLANWDISCAFPSL
jgi:hypothetical protein